MPRRKLIPLIGFALGLFVLLTVSYLYITSNKTIFSSDKTTINSPQTAVTRRLSLNEKENPYQITMDLSYEVTADPQQNGSHLFSYSATILNGKGETIEQKSNNYNVPDLQSGEKGKRTVSILLFNQKNLPTDNYVVSIIIQPNQAKDSAIKLLNFSYQVKSNVLSIHPAIPLIGLTMMVLSYILFPKKPKVISENKEKKI